MEAGKKIFLIQIILFIGFYPFSTANCLAGNEKQMIFFRFYHTYPLLGAYEYLTKKKSGTNIDISRLFIYYNSRVKSTHSETVTDSGCSMTNAIEALEEFGTCLESIWPYDITNVNTRPNGEAFSEGAKHKIQEALQISFRIR